MSLAKQESRIYEAFRVGPQAAQLNQPPFFGRLPAFFLLRVELPRSKLIFWPRVTGIDTPLGNTGLGLRLRSASVLILSAMSENSNENLLTHD